MRNALFVVVLGLFAGTPALFAHPHVFATSKARVELTEGQVKFLEIEWTFDDLFSNMIISDYDKGRKGKFTAKEVSAMKSGAFDNLENYHYFVALSVDGKEIPLPPIENFRPSISAGRLVYAFSLPLNLPVSNKERTIRATIYDDTYFVAFDKMTPADVEAETPASLALRVSIEKSKVKATWPGQVMPDQIVIKVAKVAG